MKWVLHRCHDAPGSTAATASVRPAWASEITSCTFPKAHWRQLRSNNPTEDGAGWTAFLRSLVARGLAAGG